MSSRRPFVPVDAGPSGRRRAGLNRHGRNEVEHRTGQEICLAVNARSAEEISCPVRFQGPSGVVQVIRHETGTRGSERISWKRKNQRWPTFRKTRRDPKTGVFWHQFLMNLARAHCHKTNKRPPDAINRTAFHIALTGDKIVRRRPVAYRHFRDWHLFRPPRTDP